MKKKRQNYILRLIEDHDIETQEELAQALADVGIPVTQATVSRDIRELKLTKVPARNGKQKYSAIVAGEEYAASDKYSHVLKNSVTRIETSNRFVVIKTPSGMAMALTVAIDALKIEGVAGTVAGDDTIMMAICDGADEEEVIKKIEEVVGYA